MRSELTARTEEAPPRMLGVPGRAARRTLTVPGRAACRTFTLVAALRDALAAVCPNARLPSRVPHSAALHSLSPEAFRSFAAGCVAEWIAFNCRIETRV